jgi:flagellar basal-body rod modification protein FlgD
MNGSNEINGIDFAKIGLHTPLKSDSNKTEKNEFLNLFVTQLRNQNPLDPQDGSEFLSQLAQFSVVEGIKNMEQTFSKIADSLNSNQALQASTLVGKKVQVKTDQSLYQGEKITGSIVLPGAVSDVTIEVRNDVGNLIKSYQLGGAAKGDVNFNWDGLDENGNGVPPGIYHFQAKGNVQGNEKRFETFVASNVDSVTINRNGQPPTLNISGFGKVSINDIKTIS